ncbi:hypothetical protein E2C01_012798 [Portunus trituberculatus]|uniref:Uncharacterized protein n=1 Tax=Portunus trituberculatus TaxID=210409 RepID=A0A5B7DF81_PORTR|nr:hypothetical protein [Portunus trituberculatus]
MSIKSSSFHIHSWCFYTASETYGGDQNNEDCGHQSSDLHRPFLMSIKWSNRIQTSK